MKKQQIIIMVTASVILVSGCALLAFASNQENITSDNDTVAQVAETLTIPEETKGKTKAKMKSAETSPKEPTGTIETKAEKEEPTSQTSFSELPPAATDAAKANEQTGTVEKQGTNIITGGIAENDTDTLDWTKDYLSILNEYRWFADCLINEGIESVFDNNIFSSPDSVLDYNWGCMMAETSIWYYRDFPKDREAFGYALKDLNGDGNEELILLLKDYTVLAVFTISDGKPKLLDAYWPKHRCAIYGSGLLYTLTSDGSANSYYRIQQISDSNLVTLEEYGRDYMIINGKKSSITDSAYNAFQEKYPVLFDTTASDITGSSGIEFVSIFE